MFKNTFAQTYDMGVMVENNLDHVLEDYYTVNGNVFCVADGVTRERLDFKRFKYPSNLEEALDIIKNYPNPSGATEAAKICTTTFVNSLEALKDPTENDIVSIVKKINNSIKDLNKNLKVDYSQNDYYACVAAGGVILENILVGFSICDCNIEILDENYNIIFDTRTAKESYMSLQYKPSLFVKLFYKNDWNNPKFRSYYRKLVRNNTSFLKNHKYAYGAFTGEDSALEFVHTFTVPLDNAKYIIAHSDGCDDCLKTKEDIIKTITNPEWMKNEIHEKTLITYERV